MKHPLRERGPRAFRSKGQSCSTFSDIALSTLPKILAGSASQAIRARAGYERYLSESPAPGLSRTRGHGFKAISPLRGTTGSRRGVASVPRGTVLKSCSTADRFVYVHLDPCQSPFFFGFLYSDRASRECIDGHRGASVVRMKKAFGRLRLPQGDIITDH